MFPATSQYEKTITATQSNLPLLKVNLYSYKFRMKLCWIIHMCYCIWLEVMNSSKVLGFNVSDFLPAVYRPLNFNQQKHQLARVARGGDKRADNVRVCVLPGSLNLNKSAEE